MPPNASAFESENSVSMEMREEAGGAVAVVLRGCLDMESTASCWRTLHRRLAHRRVSSLDIDASQLRFSGSTGLALMKYLDAGSMTPGARVTLRGLDDDTRKLLDQFATQELLARRPEPQFKLRVPREVGAMVRSFRQDLRDLVTFMGAVAVSLVFALARPKHLRWREIIRVMERAGANALPVISLFSLLVGLVLALEAAKPLRKLGAELYVADMIGFSAIRDTGPLVAAVMLAGRSGSAFAAELGTMKVNQELDALITMGVDPIRFLVLPRVVAALLFTPLLTLYSMLMSIAGGVIVMRSMGFPPLLLFHQIIARVQLHDLALGLEKSVVFGLVIGGIGCLRGLQTGAGPRAVGISTTRAVVNCIIFIIITNTLFSAAEYFSNK